MQRREVLRPKFDIPLVCTLDFADGMQTEDKYGNIDYQYTVNQNAAMLYLAADGRIALQQCGATAGDTVEIVKSKRGSTVLYSAAIVGDAREPLPAPPAHRRIERHPLPPSKYAEAAPQNGHHSHTQATPAPQKTVPFADYLCLAIDACAIAQEYGRQKGVSVTFLGGDVRAIANAIYINATQGGRS